MSSRRLSISAQAAAWHPSSLSSRHFPSLFKLCDQTRPKKNRWLPNISPCTTGLNIPIRNKLLDSADVLHISVKVSFYSSCRNSSSNLTFCIQPFFLVTISFKGMNKKKIKKKKKKKEIQIYQRWRTKSNFSESGSRLLQQFFTERRIQRFETQHISRPSLKNIKGEILGFGCAIAKSSLKLIYNSYTLQV